MINLLRKHEPGVRLFALVFLTLYLELALIRYTSAEVLYLGYFSNFVLISAFLGIGTGFLLAERKWNLLKWAPLAVLGLLAFVLATRIDVTALRQSTGQLFFGRPGNTLEIPLALSLAIIFVTSVFIFAAVAQATARLFKHYTPIVAYSIDIGGSLAGIAVFTLHSALGGNPLQWFAVIFVIFALLNLRHALPVVLTGAVVIAVLMLAKPADRMVSWSPYQRIDVQPVDHGYRILANGIGHQTMVPVGYKEPIYDFPYRTVKQITKRQGYDDALIIGSGGGTDVSYALHYGVKHVDAVEIDPEILAAGRKLHPAQPYSDPRVSAYNTDGRAFMERTDKRYDLIIFALPDSLASFSNLSNIRLESFLFTNESFTQARDLLKEDGVLILYNYYRKDWLVDKLANMLQDVFGHAPAVQSYGTEKQGRLAALAIGPKLQGPKRERGAVTSATDNWPFLYVETRHLPLFYIVVMLFFIACGVLSVTLAGRARLSSVGQHGPFLLMGAAFLLLETKSIVQFSLLFGATWLVNSLVFFAILLSVLLANLVVAKSNMRSPFLPFVALAIALVVQVVFPLNTLLKISDGTLRYLVASVVLFGPIFFANIVFGYFFKDSEQSHVAFGWNLIGTMIGGALEYTSLALGYQTLALVVAFLYLGTAIWAWRQHRTRALASTCSPSLSHR